MDNKKICPLSKSACNEDKCAIWCEDHQRCAMADTPFNIYCADCTLDYIGGELEDINKKLAVIGDRV